MPIGPIVILGIKKVIQGVAVKVVWELGKKALKKKKRKWW